VFPKASETPVTIKLRSILKTPEVTKILQGEKVTTESLWAARPWQIPAVHMYGRLAYKFEGMTDMINGAFMEDLSELLNAATGDQRRRKTFYEIDTEFEKMTASLLKNFNSMASLTSFLCASLRQIMIRKLAMVGKDKDGWKKADEHLTDLMDQEHMITFEDTEAAVKRCEQHLQRAAIDDASPLHEGRCLVDRRCAERRIWKTLDLERLSNGVAEHAVHTVRATLLKPCSYTPTFPRNTGATRSRTLHTSTT
jgi:hypothetical protein